jgi:cell division protein ZapA (FtsZ GTPase activity inhibitor)
VELADKTGIPPTTIKLLGKEYRIRSEMDPEHLQRVAEYVDRVLREVRASTPDTQDAAILTALNIASELMSTRGLTAVPSERIQALIDLVDSA